MSTALFVESGAGCTNPARSSVAERIREIVAAARARDMRRLERLENRAIESRENEELRLCAMAAGEAVALSCQKDNISRKRSLNRTYYNRCAAALQTNISRWVLSIGKRYASARVRDLSENVGYTPEVLSEIERVAKLHVAEFTITMRSEKGADLAGERRRFARAWNEFNKRFLKETAGEYFGEFVRVFEAHKSGVLHAHVLIECKKPLCRYADGRALPFRWKPSGVVDGRTVADWVLMVWETIRTGQLEHLGIGERHTLQPIRKGVNLFARYISKYISKDIVNRKPHLRGLRMVAYSRDFLRGCRVMAYDYDKSVVIPYWSKSANCEKWRYRRFTSFDIECASTRVRRLKLRTLCRWCGVSKAKFKRKIGTKWGFLTRNLISKIPLAKTVYGKLDKWEKFASVRNMCGDKSKTVIKTVNGEIYDYPEFMALPSQVRQETDWSVCGFVDGGEFIGLRKRISCALAAIGREFDNVYALATRTEWKSKRILKNLYAEKARIYADFVNGKMKSEKWLAYLRGWKARFDEICEDVSRWLDDVEKPAPKIEIPAMEQIEFAY